MRTGTVSYKLEDLKKGVIIPIGFVGENDFTRVIFDADEIYKKYPSASVSMKVQPPKGGVYPATVTRDGNTVIWQVKEADVANRGGGELQLTFIDGETKIKTYIAKTDVKRSLAGNGPAPDPVQDWIDDAEEVLEEVEAAEVNQPTIGQDGYWYTWNQETGEYEKTETKAQGADGAPGQDGHTPVKGTDYWTQQDQADIVAAAALETVSAVIEDTAGDGDTDKTWSADKISETTGQLLSAIQGITDINKAIVTLFQHTAFTDAEAAVAYNTLYELVYDEPTPTPSPYQKIEYVETDGASRIDTGVQFDGTKDIIVTLEMSFNGTTTYNESVLNGWAAGGAIGVLGRTDNQKLWSDGGEPSASDLGHVNEMTTCVMTIYAGTNTNTVSSFKNTYGESNKTRTHTNVANRTFLAFPLFAMSKQDSFDYLKSGLRIKSVEIKVNNVIVRSMYACYRKRDGVIGFYDTANDEFYSNAGTGTFIKGGDIS